MRLALNDRNQINKILPGLLTSGLLVLLMWQLGAGLAGLFVVSEPPVLPALSASNQPANEQITARQNFLFGTPTREVAASSLQIQQDTLSDTRLGLTLLGVIQSPKRSVAIIQQANQVHIVAEGESLMRGVELVQVAADYVVLLHQGRHERLAMEGFEAGLLTPNADAATKDDAGPVLTSAAQQRLADISQQLRENPMQMGRYIRFRGLQQDGVWTGIEISPRREQALFRALGFERGDVVVSINGRNIQELGSAPTLWNSFLQESQFELVVERNGLQETISVDLTTITE